ncbi:MAG TPA: aminotransferase class V-fold PLP-dependent enzyme [Gemmatimonadota bacterium]|nr:aminotransferase class V-fold PLP-dependent enzyme [Gemmatimonadota bacterium]
MTDVPSSLLRRTAELAERWLADLAGRPVGAGAGLAELRAALGAPLPERGASSEQVVEELARAAEPGLVASAGPRFFGFVIGGSHPAALGADWLVSAWDQNPGLYAASPAVAVIEETAARWVLELLSLPPTASVGFVTGAHMANFTALAAARHEVLRRVGWDVEEWGLEGAPPLHVLVGTEAHVSIAGALRLLGFGAGRIRPIPADGQGRMQAGPLAEALEGVRGSVIVVAQAGNVNSGAFDPLDEIADLAAERGAWLHVDGAFGLWAAVSETLRPLVAGAGRADSWATDAHKWLNVPYDSGIVAVAHPAAHRAAMGLDASYLGAREDERRNGQDWVPELSRRGRGVPVYAVLRALGREGVVELVERSCRLARRMARALDGRPGVRVVNEVVLNQVLVRFEPPGGGDADAFTREVIARVQADGVCWLGGARWSGMEVMRISIVNWSTTDADVDRSAEAILRCAAAG